MELVWDHIQPILENIIKARRKKRRDGRRKELEALYRDYIDRDLISYGETERAFIPSFDEFMLFEPVEELVMRQDEPNIRRSWVTLKKQLPQLFEKHKQGLYNEAEIFLKGVYRDLQKSHVISLSFVKNKDLLSLASSLFICEADRGEDCQINVYDLPGILSHVSQCSPGMEKPIHCSPSIIHFALSLLQLFALPPDTTMETVVAKGCSFECPCCDPLFKKSMTWFQLVCPPNIL